MQNLKVELQVGSGYYGVPVRCENVHVIIMPKAPNIVTFCDRDAPSGYCTVTLSSAGDAVQVVSDVAAALFCISESTTSYYHYATCSTWQLKVRFICAAAPGTLTTSMSSNCFEIIR